ncbi:MAG: PilT/PilU family type 4a pilus ATPase, partial [Nitrospirota bacterium]
MELSLYEMLKTMIDMGASDLHVTTGISPLIRVDGRLRPLEGYPALKPVETKALCYSVLTDAQKHSFEANNELDLSFGLKGLSRFRANIFMQRGAVAGAFRTVPFEIMTFRQLGIPEVVANLSKKPSGLILVTGPTGSGKSTTLAAMIDRINSERSDHIITIEDPIEYLHGHKKCLVNQREVKSDTNSFAAALKYVLRQDPDVILIGEMRDLETIESALTVAETGHLTFATLHTNSAIQSINRIIDVFPPHRQEQIRVQLSFVLEGIIAQQLIPRKTGRGRVLAQEGLLF